MRTGSRAKVGVRSLRLAVAAALVLGASRLPSLMSSAGAAESPPAAAPSAPPTAPAAPKLALVRPPPTGASTFPWLPDYLRVLERFPLYHAGNWHEVTAAGESLGYYGAGDRAGALAQARALLSIAYLSQEPGYDPRPSGVAATALRAEALASLHYLLRTHVTGDRDRTGGGRWGEDRAAWQSVAALVEAARLLRGPLAPADLAAVERVAAHEADHLLTAKPADAPPGGSSAAENAAAAECLIAAAALLPKHANTARWISQAQSFAVNALSAPQDRGSEVALDGRPVREWVVTQSLLPDFLLESGGAVNPDAEIETLASLAGAYSVAASHGIPVPEALTHHFEDAWRALLSLWLDGARFARPAGAAPGGPSGDPALFPVTALLEWVGSEPSVARAMERSGFEALESRQIALGDGSFDGGSPDQEAAAAAALTLAALIHRQQNGFVAPARPESLRAQLAGAWTSPVAALAVARSRSCFASWSWHGMGAPATPVGLFVPLDAADLAAAGPNQLVGSFDLQGFASARTLRTHERTVEGGVTATGQIEEGVKGGQPGLHHFVAFAALPARRVALLFDLAVAAQAVTVTRSEGLDLPLHLTGGGPHLLHSEETAAPVAIDAPGPDRTVASSWLNADDHLGVAALYSQEPFTLHSPTAGAARNAAPVVVIDTPYTTQPTAYQTGQIVRDTALLLVAGNSATTARLARDCAVLPTGKELVRAAVLGDGEGSRCLVAVNFGAREMALTLRPPAEAAPVELHLGPLETVVLELER